MKILIFLEILTVDDKPRATANDDGAMSGNVDFFLTLMSLLEDDFSNMGNKSNIRMAHKMLMCLTNIRMVSSLLRCIFNVNFFNLTQS